MFVALIVLLALQVDTQLTVDDDDTGSCESSTSDQVVNLIRKESGLIREDLKDVKLIKEGLKKVETACTSDHDVNRINAELNDVKQLQEDFQDVKTVIQQQSSSAANASSLEEEMKKFREEMVKEVKTACAPYASNQPCQSVAVDTSGLCE